MNLLRFELTKAQSPEPNHLTGVLRKEMILQVIKAESQTPNYGDKNLLAMGPAQQPFCKPVTPKNCYCPHFLAKINRQLPTKRMYSRYSHLVKQEMSAASFESC